MRYNSIKILHNQNIKDTEKKQFVKNVQCTLCNLKVKITRECDIESTRVVIKTKVLKHMYDKRTAQEYDFFLNNMKKILRDPHTIYNNKDSKRGSKCFVKEFHQQKYLIVLEECNKRGNFVVTAFSVDEGYLSKMEKVWHWEGGNLHRNT